MMQGVHSVLERNHHNGISNTQEKSYNGEHVILHTFSKRFFFLYLF